MYILGIQGSPRKNGNSDYLLTSFLEECERSGAQTSVIRPQDLDIQPCRELVVCEKKGFCPIRDQMEEMGYEKVRQAHGVVLASPVFFYGISAQAKVFIDRCQMFWGRRYKLGLKDPARFYRQGFLLSVGASGGRRLFEGVELTARYFFDAISADYAGSLTYKKVEDAGDIMTRPGLEEDIRDAVSRLMTSLKAGETVLFVSRRGGCRAVMAAAFAGEISKGRVRAVSAGLEPAAAIDPVMVKAMDEARLDVKYMRSQRVEALSGKPLDRTVFLGSAEALEAAAGRLPQDTVFWEIPDPAPLEAEGLMLVRDDIASRVKALLTRS